MNSTMLKDCDIMRLEIRKGKFVFKMAVRGKTNILSRSLKQENKEMSHKRRKSVEEELSDVEEQSLEAEEETPAIDETSLEVEEESPEVEEESPEVEESPQLTKKSPEGENDAGEEEQGGRGFENDNIGNFPPIQVCERHLGSWQSSAMVDDVINKAEKMQHSGWIDDDEGDVYKDEGKFNVIERALIHEHYMNEIKSETIETGSKTCAEDKSFKDADFVNNNEYETSSAEVVIETKPYDCVDDNVNSKEEVNDEETCAYNYILDSDEFQCDSSLDESESINHRHSYTGSEETCISKPNKHILNQINSEEKSKYSNMKKNDCVGESSIGAIDNKLCIDELFVGRREKGNKLTNRIGVEETNNSGVILKEADEGEATETEFDPLEGDEWEGMDTSDVTSCHQGKNSKKSKNSISMSSTDEEDSSSDFEDLIGQYVTYMPKEISRSVNCKRRVARAPPTSATYRRCSSELKRYFCEKCGVSYQSFTDYQSHKKTHGENKCEVCFKRFKNCRGLLAHINIHADDSLSTCLFCKMTFNYKKGLYRHIQKQHIPHMSLNTVINIITTKNDKCLSLKKFTIPKIKRQSEGIAEKGFQEKLTKKDEDSDFEKQRKKLKTVFDYERGKGKAILHDDLKSRSRNERQLKSREKSKSNSHNKRHIQSHEQNVNKSHDKRQARSNEEKKIKLRFEKKIKTYQDNETGIKVQLKKCSVCDKEFEPRILERHMRSHTGERPYLCDQCPFRCSQIGNLNKHRAVVHRKLSSKTVERVLQHKCDKCQKCFYDSAHLKRHALTHLEKTVKSYACSVCKKKFRFDSGLQRHMQLHQEGLKISCGICDRRFYDSSGLKNHMKQHTYTLPYKCIRCRISFSSLHGINRHNSMHRKDTRQTRNFPEVTECQS